jgi:allophanate hydrolase subunit 2
MGIRLVGPELKHLGKADIVSDGIVFGSIQVPANGQPIVLMADHQTTGGYTKIATVVSADLPFLAQARPGDIVKFRLVSVDEIQRELRNKAK